MRRLACLILALALALPGIATAGERVTPNHPIRTSIKSILSILVACFLFYTQNSNKTIDHDAPQGMLTKVPGFPPKPKIPFPTGSCRRFWTTYRLRIKACLTNKQQ